MLPNEVEPRLPWETNRKYGRPSLIALARPSRQKLMLSMVESFGGTHIFCGWSRCSHSKQPAMTSCRWRPRRLAALSDWLSSQTTESKAKEWFRTTSCHAMIGSARNAPTR
jgi:hypothetical protein